MHRAAFALILISAGCYSPKLANPGFYCHADDNPACPEGQRCIEGRCVGPGGHVPMGGADLAMAGGRQDGGNLPQDDLAQSPSPQDFATAPPQDHGVVTGGMTGCNGLITCANNCPASDMTCATNCQNNTTAHGNTLFNDLITCIQTQCPSTIPGDPCFNSSSAGCSSCVMAAQVQTGPCAPQLSACHGDLP